MVSDSGRPAVGQPDVVFLQETRATDEWVHKLADQHARGWGYREERLDSPLSFWCETPTSAGGVAMLFKPNSIMKHLRPIWKAQWSPWFMAVEADLHGAPVTLVNIYLPSGQNKRAREQLFHSLGQLPKPTGRRLLGGDFNCTLNAEFNRSNGNGSGTMHDSSGLQLLLEHWQVRDATQDDQDTVQTEADKREFHAVSHTYKYKTRNGDLATSRLDRWYVDQEHQGDIRQVDVAPPVLESDHDAVTQALATRPDPRWKTHRGQQLRYPIPRRSSEEVQQLSHAAIAEYASISQTAGAAAAAEVWDVCKNAIRLQCLLAIRARARMARRAYQQRRKRLTLVLRAALRIANPPAVPGPPTLESIPSGMSEMGIDPAEKVMALRRSITRLEKGRATTMQSTYRDVPGRNGRSEASVLQARLNQTRQDSLGRAPDQT